MTNSTSASCTWSGTDTGAGVDHYVYSLDGATAVSTTSTSSPSISGLTQGSHSFSVYAVDAAGNQDATPAIYSWTVDTTAPDTSIVTKPAAVTNSTSASFSWSGTDTGAGVDHYVYSLDGAT